MKVIIVHKEEYGVQRCFLAPDNFEFIDDMVHDFYKETHFEPQASITIPCYPKTKEENKYTAKVDFYAIIRVDEFYTWLCAKYNLAEVEFINSPVLY